MTYEFDAFCERLFARAQEAGFEASEVFFQDGQSFTLTIYRGEVDKYQVSGTRGLGFRALLSGRLGYAYTQAFDDEAVDFLVETAKANALLIETDDPQFIYTGDESYPEVPGANPDLDAVTPREKIERALELEKAVLSLKDAGAPVEECEISLSTGRGRVRIRNSRGLNLEHADNFTSAVAEVIVKKDGMTNTGYAFRAGKAFDVLSAADIAREAVEEAANYLGAKPVPTGSYPVILRNDMMASILSTFSGCFSADAAQKGMSLLKGKEGERIAADGVTLVDDPLLPGGFASTPFDDEGVAARTKNVIENGVLMTLLHNLKTAAKAGVATTGNAHRAGFSSPVGVAASNFFLKPGALTRDALFARMGDGLFITELQGLHSGANPITGDFSLAAKGFRVEAGKKTTPVEQITIAGNFFALLGDIVAMADDLWFEPGGESVGSASTLLRALSVAGA